MKMSESRQTAREERWEGRGRMNESSEGRDGEKVSFGAEDEAELSGRKTYTTSRSVDLNSHLLLLLLLTSACV